MSGGSPFSVPAWAVSAGVAEPRFGRQLPDGGYDLGCFQTEMGLLRRLQRWAGDESPGKPLMCFDYDGHATLCRTSGWSEPDVVWRSPVVGESGLRDVLMHIGADHMLRRGLGERPAPGTLGTVEHVHGSWWRFDAREHGGALIEWEADGTFVGAAEVKHPLELERVDLDPHGAVERSWGPWEGEPRHLNARGLVGAMTAAQARVAMAAAVGSCAGTWAADVGWRPCGAGNPGGCPKHRGAS